jgi:hypothetical protein
MLSRIYLRRIIYSHIGKLVANESKAELRLFVIVFYSRFPIKRSLIFQCETRSICFKVSVKRVELT